MNLDKEAEAQAIPSKIQPRQLKVILQQYTNQRIPQSKIPDKIYQDHGVRMALCTVEHHIQKLGIVTSRRNGLSEQEEVEVIQLASLDDPIGACGNRNLQEKLALRGIHIPRDTIGRIRRDTNPDAVAARHPVTRRVHRSGLWSIGPNEEWGVDGHEKLVPSMGIAVWGIIDKFSQLELGLWAVPTARAVNLPPILFLYAVKQIGGIPLSITGDKGNELGQLISLSIALRERFQPFISNDQIPAFKTVKSVHNITRERAWGPLHKQELANIQHYYLSGKADAGYTETSEIHRDFSLWIWGKIVQRRLDEYRKDDDVHVIRKQKDRKRPSGQKGDLYRNPGDHGPYQNVLIPVDQTTIDALLDEYDRPDLLRFGSEQTAQICADIYTLIGSPLPIAIYGWKIFVDMIDYYAIHYA